MNHPVSQKNELCDEGTFFGTPGTGVYRLDGQSVSPTDILLPLVFFFALYRTDTRLVVIDFVSPSLNVGLFFPSVIAAIVH